MSTPRRPLPALARPAVGTLLALVLTGCGASLDAQTYQERINADSTNTAIGTIDMRDIRVDAADEDRIHPAGSDVEVSMYLINNDDEADRLLEVTSPDAVSVTLMEDGEEVDSLEIPALGFVGGEGALVMQELTEQLFEGAYTTMTFRFERAGTTEVEVPVKTSGETDRPVYTGDGEEEPALQAPAGGHGEEDEEGEEEVIGEPEGGEGEEGEG